MNNSYDPISDRIKALNPSATIAMAQKVLQLKNLGKKIIDLSVGEPNLNTPIYIQQAAIEAIQSKKYFGYAPVSGYTDLKLAIVQKLHKENNIECTTEQIVVSTGAKQSIANTLLTIINPGEEIIVYTPYWVSYFSLIQLAKGIPIFLKGTFENNFIPTPQQLQKAITPKTKAIIYSSPSNPTGAILTHTDLQNIVDIIYPHKKIFVISDEIYEYLNFSHKKHVSIASLRGMQERTITINGFSKGFAMTGWRVGYLVAPENIAKGCEKLQSQITSASNSISQRAALAALQGNYLQEIEGMKVVYKKNRDYIIEFFQKNIPQIKCNIPQGAFYLFIDVSYFYGKKNHNYTITSADDFCIYILEKAHVSMVSGIAFGEKNCVRISYAASYHELICACKQIKIALSNLDNN